jgi:hypothetical protein
VDKLRDKVWLLAQRCRAASGSVIQNFCFIICQQKLFPRKLFRTFTGTQEAKMTLRVVGAGLPRTGTASLKAGLEYLLQGRCYHMREIPEHPFELGEDWNRAIAGDNPDWDRLLEGYVATVDWPASMFWQELSVANPEALVLLSLRESAEVWWKSADRTILPYARMALAPDWAGGHSFTDVLERFTGMKDWNDPAVLMQAYDRHNQAVRQAAPSQRLLEWTVGDGWEPICKALDLPVPDMPFPHTNQREQWAP